MCTQTNKQAVALQKSICLWLEKWKQSLFLVGFQTQSHIFSGVYITPRCKKSWMYLGN